MILLGRSRERGKVVVSLAFGLSTDTERERGTVVRGEGNNAARETKEGVTTTRCVGGGDNTTRA